MICSMKAIFRALNSTVPYGKILMTKYYNTSPKRKTTHTLLRIYHESFIAYAYCELLVF
jgi:hypothetical protein